MHALARSTAALQALLQKFRGPVVDVVSSPSASSAFALHFCLVAPLPSHCSLAVGRESNPPDLTLRAGLRATLLGCWAAGLLGALETA